RPRLRPPRHGPGPLLVALRVLDRGAARARRGTRRPRATVALVALVALAAPARGDEAERELLRQRVGLDRAGGEGRIGRDRRASTTVLPDLYERAGFELLWTRPGAAEGLLAAVRGAAAHGLDPNDYHRPEIERLLAVPQRDLEQRVGLDLLLTDALVRLAY